MLKYSICSGIPQNEDSEKLVAPPKFCDLWRVLLSSSVQAVRTSKYNVSVLKLVKENLFLCSLPSACITKMPLWRVNIEGEQSCNVQIQLKKYIYMFARTLVRPPNVSSRNTGAEGTRNGMLSVALFTSRSLFLMFFYSASETGKRSI